MLQHRNPHAPLAHSDASLIPNAPSCQARGWATEVCAGIDTDGHSQNSACHLFGITLTLTEAGLKEGPGLGLAPVALAFQYMAMLAKQGEGKVAGGGGLVGCLSAGSSERQAVGCGSTPMTRPLGRSSKAVVIFPTPVLLLPLPACSPRAPGVGVAGAQGGGGDEVHVPGGGEACTHTHASGFEAMEMFGALQLFCLVVVRRFTSYVLYGPEHTQRECTVDRVPGPSRIARRTQWTL